MARCILHVGMHKTGSTSIQNSLKDLDDANFYYARLLGQPNHGLSLPSVVADHDYKRLVGKPFARDEKALQEQSVQARKDLISSIDVAQGRTLICSGEGILLMKPSILTKLKNFLARHGYDDINVIAYVRPPYSFISSAAQQKIRMGSFNRLDIARCWPSYEKRFAKLFDVFDASKITLIKFQGNALIGNDAVTDFCSRTGIPLDSIRPERKNESIPRLAAQLRYQFTTHAEKEGLRPMRPGAGSALCYRLRELDQTKFRLAPSFLKPFVESFRADIEWMERRLGETLDEDMTDSETDIHGEAGLLEPIPGIDEKLRALIVKDGDEVPDDAEGNTLKLLQVIAANAKKQMVAEAVAGEGDAGLIAQRAARRERREELAGTGDGTADRIERRKARKLARQSGQASGTPEGGDSDKARRRSGKRAARQAERAQGNAGERAARKIASQPDAQEEGQHSLNADAKLTDEMRNERRRRKARLAARER